jgi:hypothetical protein
MIVKIEQRREEEESCVEEFHVQKFWINTKSLDSDSWFSYILCVCIVECYAHECFTPSVMHLLFMPCVYDFLLNV